MKRSKKIKAFTLSEMIVVLIITVIVVGLAFSVLSLVQKQMYAIQANFEKTSEINQLETALYIDFHKYSDIKLSSRDNELKLKSEIDSLSYQFFENKIIRAKDTFSVTIHKKWFFFNGEQIVNGKVDAIKLETSKETQNQNIFVFKQNAAAQFMTSQ